MGIHRDTRLAEVQIVAVENNAIFESTGTDCVRLRGLTQFLETAVPGTRKPLILNAWRDGREAEGARLEIDSARAC